MATLEDLVEFVEYNPVISDNYKVDFNATKGSYKIGKKSFATPDSAMAEMIRIVREARASGF
jgi:hypothetical protein